MKNCNRIDTEQGQILDLYDKLKNLVNYLSGALDIDADGNISFGHDVYADGNIIAGLDVSIDRELFLEAFASLKTKTGARALQAGQNIDMQDNDDGTTTISATAGGEAFVCVNNFSNAYNRLAIIPKNYKPVAAYSDDGFETLNPNYNSWQVTESGDEITYSETGNFATLTWTYQGGRADGTPPFSVLCKKQ